MPPPRTTPPPSPGKPRRRPAPPVSGAWIWLVIGLALVALIVLSTTTNSIEIQYSSFIRLLDTNSKNIKKIWFGSNDRISGELEDVSALPEQTEEDRELKRSFENKKTTKFYTRHWPLQDTELSKELNKKIREHNLKVEVKEDQFAWVGPV